MMAGLGKMPHYAAEGPGGGVNQNAATRGRREGKRRWEVRRVDVGSAPMAAVPWISVGFRQRTLR